MTDETPVLRVDRDADGPLATFRHHLWLGDHFLCVLDDDQADAIEALIAKAARADELLAAAKAADEWQRRAEDAEAQVERLRDGWGQLGPLLDALNKLTAIPSGHDNQFENAANDVCSIFGNLPDALVGPKRARFATTPDPDAPHPLAYPVDPTDRDGEQVPTWELPGRFVQRLGGGWERYHSLGTEAEWCTYDPTFACTDYTYLVRRVAPPAPPQPETVTERERLAMLLDAWFSVDAHRGIVPDETELDLSYEVAPLTYGDLRAIRKALADGGEL